MRVVVDTNVVVSFLLRPRSVPGRAFIEISAHHTLLISGAVLAEMVEVLAYPKIERYVPTRVRAASLRRLIRIAEEVDPAERIAQCRDPRDDKFLELACSGGADCIVTGDEDLLAIGPFRGIEVITPARFLELHGRKKV